MTREEIVEFIEDRGYNDCQIVLADGLEDAFVGVAIRCGGVPVAVYDYEKCVKILMDRDSVSEDDAREHMDYNVVGAWVGEATPWFLTDLIVVAEKPKADVN